MTPCDTDLLICGLIATGVLFFLAGLAFDRIRLALMYRRWLMRGDR